MTAVIASSVAAAITAPSPIEAAVIPWAVVPMKPVIPISGVAVVIGTGVSIVWPVTVIVGAGGHNRAAGKEHHRQGARRVVSSYFQYKQFQEEKFSRGHGGPVAPAEAIFDVHSAKPGPVPGRSILCPYVRTQTGPADESCAQKAPGRARLRLFFSSLIRAMISLYSKKREDPMTYFAWLIFLGAAMLEVGGDAVVRQGLRGSNLAIILLGCATLGAYGVLVNTVRWDFSRLLGVYVAVFALVSVLTGRFVFKEDVPLTTWIGLAVIVCGGMVIQFGNRM